MKHISLGDLTKSDPTQPPDYDEPPKFHHQHRNANCCNRLCYFYPRTVMDRHRLADYKMTGEMLEDMRMDDEETIRIIENLELNIAKRFEKRGDKNFSSF